MAQVLDRLLATARRTAQPYRLSTKVTFTFVGVCTAAFLALLFARMLLDVDPCPSVMVRDGPTRTVPVSVACHLQPWWAEFAISLVENLAAGLVVATVVALLLLLIQTEDGIQEDIASLDSWKIHDALIAPLKETKTYRFRGRSGRFIRATVMPALDEAARRETRPRALSMILPDPTDDANLANYARYRNSLSFETKHWTIEDIRVEIIATILKAAHLASLNQFFEARVFLKSDYSIFRMDMSENGVVLTREDPAWPGIACSSSSKFYASYETEFRVESEAARELTLHTVDLPLGFKDSHINPALTALGFAIVLDPAICLRVVEAVFKPVVPYA